MKKENKVPQDEGKKSGVKDDNATRVASLTTKVEELKAKLEVALEGQKKAETQRNDVMAMHVRLQADFDNYRKRTNEQLQSARKDGIADTITKTIPVLDVINQALKMITDVKVREGVEMINRQLLDTFSSFGVCEIKALGQQFDPELHNAILQVEAEKPEDSGKVMEVFQKGYVMGDKVLRHSVVKVAR